MSISKQSKKTIASTKRYYNTHAREWTETKTNSFHHEREFTKFASLLSQKAKVLDIGCAAGVLVPLFLGIGRHVTYYGIDISDSFIKIARRRYPQLNFCVGNIAERETLPKVKFDGFLAAASLMHVPFENWDSMFENIERVSKPQAKGYITLPTEHPSGKDDDRQFTILTAKEQEAYLKSRGWKILEKGVKDGFTKANIWRSYLVELP